MQIRNFPEGTPTPNDLILFQSTDDDSFRKTTLSQVSGNSRWTAVNSDYAANSGEKILNRSTTNITITLPVVTVGEIEIFCVNGRAVVDAQGQPYNGTVYQINTLVIEGVNRYVKLLYINESIGWYPLTGELTPVGVVASGITLHIEGSLTDISGNDRALIPTANSPEIAIGFDDKPTLRFSGESVQELSIQPFLASTNGATLYIVFSPNDNQYNLIKTGNFDDYWRFSGNGAGYFGTFRGSRYEGYPPGMPSSGNHLISIHASATTYEVFQNNVTKGLRTDNTYQIGDRFVIASDDKRYTGDISLLLVYPFYISPNSTSHTSNVQTIKSKFPSLPFTL